MEEEEKKKWREIVGLLYRRSTLWPTDERSEKRKKNAEWREIYSHIFSKEKKKINKWSHSSTNIIVYIYIQIDIHGSARENLKLFFPSPPNLFSWFSLFFSIHILLTFPYFQDMSTLLIWSHFFFSPLMIHTLTITIEHNYINMRHNFSPTLSFFFWLIDLHLFFNFLLLACRPSFKHTNT